MNVTTIKFKGKDLKVHELTVAQLDDLLGSTEPLSMIDRIFNPDMVSEQMLVLSTGLPVGELRSCQPSALRPLVEAVKEVNPDFLSGLRSLTR
jgi:hypothetical protein